MIESKILNDTRVYSDLQSIKSLHHVNTTDPAAAKKEVAQQFEAMLVKMLLKSMRDANQAFSSELMSSDQSSFYQEMYDQQMSLVMSHSGVGLSKSIEDYLNRVESKNPQSLQTKPETKAILTSAIKETEASKADTDSITALSSPLKDAGGTKDNDEANTFKDPHDFIKTLWSSAKEAAKILGTDPRILIAQAALETNWGKSIISHQDGSSSKNLFNIKADKSWQSKSVERDALEHVDGVVVKEKSHFRAYNSYLESFNDYVHFLQSNGRYKEALQKAAEPEKYVQSLQKASYATDEKYSEKIMQIFSSKKFNAMFSSLNLI